MAPSVVFVHLDSESSHAGACHPTVGKSERETAGGSPLPPATRDGSVVLNERALEVIYLICDESVSLFALTPDDYRIGRALGMVA